jgi:hypothetical protein
LYQISTLEVAWPEDDANAANKAYVDEHVAPLADKANLIKTPHIDWNPASFNVPAGRTLRFDDLTVPVLSGALPTIAQFAQVNGQPTQLFGFYSNDGGATTLAGMFHVNGDASAFVTDVALYDGANWHNGGDYILRYGITGHFNQNIGSAVLTGFDLSGDISVVDVPNKDLIDVENEVQEKQNKLTAGANVEISTADPHNPVITAKTVLPEVTSPDGLIADAKLTAGLIAAAAAVTRDRGVVVSAYADKMVYVADEIAIEYRGGNYALGDSLQYAPPNGLMDVLVVATELGSGDSIEGFTVSSPGASETDFAGSDIPFTTSGAGVLATFNITTKPEAGRKLADVVNPTEGDVVRVLVDETHGGQMYQYTFADTNGDGLAHWISLSAVGSTRDFFTEPIQSGELGAKVVEDGKVADTDTGSIVEDDNKFASDATFTFGNLKKAIVSKINALFSKKVDKLTEAGNYLYSHNGANQADIGYSMAPAVSSIAQRHVGGALEVGDPTTDADATHKGYVDAADEAVKGYVDDITVNGIAQDAAQDVKTLYAFETLEDFEAAESSIPVGAEVDKLYEYPDNLAGVMVVPDYANADSTNKFDTQTASSSWTVDKMGFAWISSFKNNAVDGYIQVYFNGRPISIVGMTGGTTGGLGQHLVYPVKRGDVINSVFSSGISGTCVCRFIPPVLVAKELPVVVEKNGSYSLDEVKTADTWIDGRPIYKRTFTGSVTVAANTWLTNYEVGTIGTEFDTVVEISGTANRGNGQWSKIVKTDYNLDLSVKQCTDVPVLANGTVIWNSYMSIARTDSPYYITVYYTKTTDVV